MRRQPLSSKVLSILTNTFSEVQIPPLSTHISVFEKLLREIEKQRERAMKREKETSLFLFRNEQRERERERKKKTFHILLRNEQREI